MAQKRVAAIHDISCFGKCSLTVALPLISAAGIETAVIPTAVLSTHTGGFTGYTFRDLSEDIVPVARHWKSENITVDAVYTGYLCSKQQIYLVLEAARLISRRDTLLITDPVMADNGKLYAAFDERFPAEMAKVCAKADIILPNITEACLLTGTEYRTEYGEAYIRDLLERLLDLGCRTAVLTGVSYEPGKLGVAYLDRSGKDFSYFTRRCPQSFHGTGDLYSSTVLGGVMRGLDLGDALALAADFVVACIEASASSTEPRWYGVEFESQIPLLCRMLEERLKK